MIRYWWWVPVYGFVAYWVGFLSCWLVVMS